MSYVEDQGGSGIGYVKGKDLSAWTPHIVEPTANSLLRVNALWLANLTVLHVGNNCSSSNIKPDYNIFDLTPIGCPETINKS
jgi:hypothetical protein